MSWNGVKKQTNLEDTKAWCDEMGIERYTINNKGEIDVDGSVNLNKSNFKELPYKFGIVDRMFSLSGNKNLTSLKNCPNYVGGYFSCTGCHNLKSLKGSPMKIGRDFVCYGCSQLDSLEGCPQEVKKDFLCGKCKRKFTKEEVESVCNVRNNIDLT